MGTGQGDAGWKLMWSGVFYLPPPHPLSPNLIYSLSANLGYFLIPPPPICLCADVIYGSPLKQIIKRFRRLLTLKKYGVMEYMYWIQEFDNLLPLEFQIYTSLKILLKTIMQNTSQ